MDDILSEQQGQLFLITFNRVAKHNAFDDTMLNHIQRLIDEAQNNTTIAVIILKANGQHFSAGADAAWMQRMVRYNQEENFADAMILAKVLHSLYSCTKPTIAMVQGAAFGGGAGLAAACDITIAADTAEFCFSEVKLGLIPATISPYVIKAIGARAACELFMTARRIDTQRAMQLQLIQHCVPEQELLPFTLNYAKQLTTLAPEAVRASKALVRTVAEQPIDESLLHYTAQLIAQKRVSAEGQQGLNAFINKTKPQW